MQLPADHPRVSGLFVAFTTNITSAHFGLVSHNTIVPVNDIRAKERDQRVVKLARYLCEQRDGQAKINQPGRLHWGKPLSRASLADALAPAASLNNIRYVSPKFLGALIHV
jgi:hypothetical protein